MKRILENVSLAVLIDFPAHFCEEYIRFFIFILKGEKDFGNEQTVEICESHSKPLKEQNK